MSDIVVDLPRLGGQTFKITVVEEPGCVNFDGVDANTGRVNSFSGYCVDILEAISRPDRADFKYELLTPSGYAEKCVPRLETNATSDSSLVPYSETYYGQFNCGQGDVTDMPSSDDISTDMYLSLFYVTPSRLLVNQFTIPFSPPTRGTLTMVGTATGIADFDDLVAKQEANEQGPVCARISVAYVDWLKETYPTLQVIEVDDSDLYNLFNDGTCDIFIHVYPVATKFVLTRFQNDECLANGKPIGVIGEPLNFGLNFDAIGVGNHIPPETVNTLSYWMVVMMSCAAGSEECPDGNFHSFYSGNLGTGKECGYVQNPSTGSNLSSGAIAGIIVGLCAFVALAGIAWHKIQANKQQARFRKRLVQQVARNITIGRSPSQLDADAIANELKHIGKNKDGTISKPALKDWMNDDKLGALSDDDFEALWSALDADNSGLVDPVEFCAVLGTCGPEFESTYNEQQRMRKEEKLQWASQRLSVIAKKTPEA
jgi:ABC-type amino acid transport substrate-binding protein/Ca2+-binding EF-hand superfamily protein